MSTHKIILNIGSNVGNKSANILRAMRILQNKLNISVISRIYASESLLKDKQDRYFNVSVSGKTFLNPEELLYFVKQIEATMGRQNTGRWQERIIDIDIIDYDNKVINIDQLKIPHEGLYTRSFFIYPLLEIIPDYVMPDGVTSVKNLAQRIEDKLNIKVMGELKWL